TSPSVPRSVARPRSVSTAPTASGATCRSAATALIRPAIPAARRSAENDDVPRTRKSVRPSITTGADRAPASESALCDWLSPAGRSSAASTGAASASGARVSTQTNDSARSVRRRFHRGGPIMATKLSSVQDAAAVRSLRSRRVSTPRLEDDMVPRVATIGIDGRGAVKLVTFQIAGQTDPLPGLFTERGVVSLADAVPRGATPTATMTGIIDGFDRLRPALEKLAREGKGIPASDVRLRAPLPRPGKILACIANYWEHGALEARPLNMFLKSADAVIGPGDTIVLPEFTEPWIFMHEAELALVIKGPAKMVKRDNWRTAVFGYTGMIDVSARGEGRRTWKTGSWLGKSFDTFAPIGPCIATIDEIPNPNDVHVQFWVDGQLRHNYNTDDMEHLVPELVEFATTIMTLNSGDLIACGTNHEGLGPLQ